MVHLELMPDQSSDAYLRSQRRFISRRVVPKMMVSDNGKTFRCKRLQKFDVKHGIKWRFNLAKAAWWGVIYERLIRSIKKCLIKSIGKKRLSYDELLTVLAEIESVLNRRPLTNLDENDVEEPLKPSHLFCGRSLLDRHEVEDNVEEPPDTTAEEMTRRSRCTKQVVDSFWMRWRKEYLLSLRESHWMSNQEEAMVHAGDVVCVLRKMVSKEEGGRLEE